MLIKIYSIYDEVAKLFFPPFNFASDEEAARMFANCVNTENHKFEQNPGDYILHYVGQWDDKEGTFVLLDSPLQLAIGTDFVRPQIEPMPL